MTNSNNKLNKSNYFNSKKIQHHQSLSLFWILSFVFVLIALLTTVGWKLTPIYYTNHIRKIWPRMISEEELSRANGESSTSYLWLGISGNVYDVSSGKKHYAPGGSYHFFAGRDASRAFITGCFEHECLISDVSDFGEEKTKELASWTEFFDRKYPFVGILNKH
eukprot:gb/GECH01000706.1/.p1 GENE.gb/GECH01000706.1/~~gb/GECH01000706.1/.p1  ORF type:complete len:164 (+),score=38.44 gb/GECH01000706.1/:1-492(+)